MKQSFWQNLPILRFLAGFWGWVTMLLFIVDFFSHHLLSEGITTAAVIYGAILAMYAGSKEYKRWQQKKNYKSDHFGELYIITWTLVMVIFVALTFLLSGYYKIPGEFPAVYLTVLSVFILSRESKSFIAKS